MFSPLPTIQLDEDPQLISYCRGAQALSSGEFLEAPAVVTLETVGARDHQQPLFFSEASDLPQICGPSVVYVLSPGITDGSILSTACNYSLCQPLSTLYISRSVVCILHSL